MNLCLLRLRCIAYCVDAENQSMFLDSLCGDAAWRARYALDRSGQPLPWAVHEAELRATFPYKVFALRSMLSVPYFEKALYELPEDEVTAERIQALADEVEKEVQGGLAPRPMLSVPHIISDEASCYYRKCFWKKSVHLLCHRGLPRPFWLRWRYFCDSAMRTRCLHGAR